jgi:hypothetical protein
MDALADALVTLTEHICNKDPDREVGGFLGGRFGYGAEWDSAVFEMFPDGDYDCDCGFDEKDWQWSKDNKHTEDCYQSEYRRLAIAAGADEEGGYIGRPKHRSWEHWRKTEDGIYRDLCNKHGFDFKAGGYAGHCTCYHDKAYAEWCKDNKHAPRCVVVRPNFRHKPSGLTVRWYKYIGRDMEVEGSGDVAAILAECIADVAAPPFEPYVYKPPTEAEMAEMDKIFNKMVEDGAIQFVEFGGDDEESDDDIPF